MGVEVGSIGVSVGLGTGTVWVSSPQPTNSISAAVRRSSGMILSFMGLYYPKSLLNGSAEVSALGGSPPLMTNYSTFLFSKVCHGYRHTHTNKT